MNKKIIALGMMTALVATGANAAENWPNWYVGLHGGVNFHPDSDVTIGGTTSELETDAGYLLGASLGYQLATVPMRFELEYTFRRNVADTLGGLPQDGDLDSHSTMVNSYYDFQTETAWSPYVGAGIGASNVEFNDPTAPLDDTVFAWQLMVGLSYEPQTVMPNTVWSVGYRYFATDDAEFSFAGVPGEVEYSSHGVEAGARFRF